MSNAQLEAVLDPVEDYVDELPPGSTLLHGQYRIDSFLNSGGFGITYLASDSLDRKIVIKECFPRAFCSRANTTVTARSRIHANDFKKTVRLFVQEAKSLSKLVHPNIVGVHQVFEDNQTAYMAMDHVEGVDLLQLIEWKDRTLKPAEIVVILKKLLGAVAFVHKEGILHRDISPDNILIRTNGDPVLIDFGAARELASKTSRAMSAMRVVKEGYSPQEFYITGGVQGDFSDLYALGASIYHAISGQAPPDSQARLMAIAEQSGDPYIPLDGKHRGYPDGFLASIDKALNVLPKDRIASANDWLDLISVRLKSRAQVLETLVVLEEPSFRRSATAEANSSMTPNTDVLIGKIVEDAKREIKELAVPLAIAVPDAAPDALPDGAPADGVVAALPKDDVVVPLASRRRVPFTAQLGVAALIFAAIGIGAMQMQAFGPSVEEATLAHPVVPSPEETVVAAETTPANPTPGFPLLMTATDGSISRPDIRAVSRVAPPRPAPLTLRVSAAPAAAPLVASALAPASAAADVPVAAIVPETAKAKVPAVTAEAKKPAAPTQNATAAVPALAEVAAPAPVATGDAAPAKAATTATPLPAFDPPPAAIFARLQLETIRPNTAAMSADQVAEARWFIEMSFRTSLNETKDGVFIDIDRVSNAVHKVPENHWVAEGAAILELAGKKIDGSATIEQLLLAVPDLGTGTQLQTPVTYRAANGRTAQQGMLAVPVVRLVELRSGDKFQVNAGDGAWRTLVKSVDAPVRGGLRAGDILVSETTTGRALVASDSLEKIFGSLAADHVAEATFVVLRGEEEVTATLPLTPES